MLESIPNKFQLFIKMQKMRGQKMQNKILHI